MTQFSRMKSGAAAAVVLAFLASAACDDAPPILDVEEEEVAVTIVQRDPILIVDGQRGFTAVVANDTTAGVNRGVRWSTSDTDVVTIDPSTGIAMGVAVGTAKIYATSKFRPAAKDSVNATVQTLPAARIPTQLIH